MAQTDEITPPKEVTQAQKTVADLEADRANLDRQIAEASVLIQAWENFNRTLRGEFIPPAARAESKPRKATGTRAKPGTLPTLQGKIVGVVGRYDAGAKAESINEELRGEYDAKQIAAALFKMKKSGVLAQAGARQPYTLGTNAPRAETPAAPTPTEEEPAPALAEQEAE